LEMIRKLRQTQVSAWLVPLCYAFVAMIVGFGTPRLAGTLLPGFVSTISVGAAIGIFSAVASGMIALTGIVFSLTFLMVQFSATAYSPRLVLWIARDPLMSHALGIFTATFLYSLTALAWVDRNGSGRVPWVGVGVVALLLCTSIIMFIALIQRVGMLQVNRMLVFTGDHGRDVIEHLYPPIETPPTPASAENYRAPRMRTLLHRGYPRSVQEVDVPALVHLASQYECVIEMAVAVGDPVFDSMPIFRTLGGATPIPDELLTDAIQLGEERTFSQDPKYAIRLLVDIAIKALSPAVNDPTTAVQAMDQIEDLLLRLGRRRLEIGAFHDVHGNLRLLINFPAWEDFLRLAFDEIRYYGATSTQVMRRMKALVSDLITVLPEERRVALNYWHVRLQATIDRSFPDSEDKLDASAEDRQGLGGSGQRT
jgi:uncharacterized membrane protein